MNSVIGWLFYIILGLATFQYFIIGPNFTYYWFLFNGIWIHLHKNAFIEQWPIFQWFFEKYHDIHFKEPSYQPCLIVMSALEFYLMSPICLFIAICLKHNLNPVLTNYLIGIISCIQIITSMLFCADEWSLHFVNMYGSSLLSYSFTKIYNFLFLFVTAKPIWIIVPFCEVYSAYQQLIQQQLKHKKN